MTFVWPLLLWAAAAATDWTRLLPPGQATTPEEFDGYLRVVNAGSPEEVVKAGQAFTAGWPGSELSVNVLMLEMEAYRSLGRRGEAIDAGERALKRTPDSLPFVLVTLANLLADQSPARAEDYAARALRLVEAYRLPRSLPPEEWERLKRRLQSQAHAALGLAAVKRDRGAAALAEFETAVSLAPEPDASQIYRLGKLYRTLGRIPEARQRFRQALELPEPLIRKLAEEELRTLPK
jgi:tetratricopeptide (TPR) repeat protein